jgi:Arc/MetJ-type ribon-helix-helix transcriptional regulator
MEAAMIRTQIQLTEEQSAEIKRLAAERSLSMAEVIRQGLDDYLQRTATVRPEERIRRAIEAAGQFGSGMSDVSARHNEHLAEAYKE